MNTPRDHDPLLEAVLGEIGDNDTACLDLLLAGARRRRRGRRVRQGLVAGGLPLLVVLGVLIGWEPAKSPAPAVPLTYTLVRTEAAMSPDEIRTSAASMDWVRSVPALADAGVQIVSTDEGTQGAIMPADDRTFLASLPGPAGFIGDGPSRRLVLLTPNPSDSLIFP